MSSVLRTVAAVGMLVSLVGLAGCGTMPPMVANASLYERLGGEKAIMAVSEDLLTRVANDKAVDLKRAGTSHPWDPTPANLMILKVRLAAFLSKVTGGPDYYAAVGGRDMKTAHQGMRITAAEWDAVAKDTVATLDHFNVPAREKGEVMALVESLRKDIVEAP